MYPKLVPEVMLGELQGSRPKIGNLDEIGQYPVPVQLEQWDEIQEDDEVVQQSETKQQLSERPLRQKEQQDRTSARQDGLCERTRERLQYPRAGVEHQPVRGVHE